MMASPQFVFYVTCLFLVEMAQMTGLKFSSSVRQESHFVSVTSGGNLTLQCFYEGDVAARFYWYKQTLGQKPGLISIFYTFNINGTFFEKFKNNPRFTLDTGNGKNHLTIRDVQISDSATYYCASGYSYEYKFLETVTVSVEGSGVSVQAVVHQSASETIQPGGSVTLNCTVHTGTCDGEHWVYWFRDSEQSRPGLIYTHGGSSDQCERKPETQTHSCVYNLPMKSLNPSHAGTNYCAVASCGHILFGNGTMLDIEDKVLLYSLSGALAVTTILSVFLAFLLCKMNKRNTCKSTESPGRFSASLTTNAEGHENEENLHYAALRQHTVNRPRRHSNNTASHCVYSRIKQ